MPDILKDLESHYGFSDCPHFFSAYLRYLAVFQNLSELSVESIYISLREFCQFIHYRHKFHSKPSSADAHKDLSICNMPLSELACVSEMDIEEYLCFLDTVVGNKSLTVRRKITHLRKFYQYLYDQQTELGISVPENPVKNLSSPTSQAPKLKLLSEHTVKKLLGAVAGPNAVRDIAIIQLILSTGISLQEIANLNEDDYLGNIIYVRGTKARTAYLSPEAEDTMEEYLSTYRAPMEDQLRDKALFVSQSRRKRLTPRCIQMSIGKHMANAGLAAKGYTAQDLRDTAVASMLKSVSKRERPYLLAELGFRSPRSAARFDVISENGRRNT